MKSRINKIELVYNSYINNFPSRRIRKYLLKKFLASFGSRNGVQMNCKFMSGKDIHLGNHNAINFGCILDARRTDIRLGNNISIGPEALILSFDSGYGELGPDDKRRETFIDDYSWICYRSIIFPGVKIGKGAVVGAGAVVINDINPYTIVAGNPAKLIGRRNKTLDYRINYDPWLM